MNRATTLISICARHITAATLLAAVIVPLTASAADNSIKQILTNTQDILNLLIQIMMTLTFVVFIWGIVKFIAAAGNPQKISQAKQTMIYGIIGIAIMAMITGIIVFLQTYFGIQGGVPITVPQFTPV